MNLRRPERARNEGYKGPTRLKVLHNLCRVELPFEPFDPSNDLEEAHDNPFKQFKVTLPSRRSQLDLYMAFKDRFSGFVLTEGPDAAAEREGNTLMFSTSLT